MKLPKFNFGFYFMLWQRFKLIWRFPSDFSSGVIMDSVDDEEDETEGETSSSPSTRKICDFRDLSYDF